MSLRVEAHDNNEVIYLAFDPDGYWSSADVVSETVTVDRDKQGVAIGVELIGSSAQRMLAVIQATLDEITR